MAEFKIHENLKRLVLIDGKSVFYRGYYAMGNLALADGTPTGGVYGFAAIAMEIVRKLKPTKVVVAWDSKTSTEKRRAIFPEYKAGRVKPGEDFYAQIPLLKELVSALGWEFVEIDEYEADDIIGTLSRQADESLDKNGHCEYETFIVSSDLDMLQIVDENTRMLRILKGFTEIEEINVSEIEKKYGILKRQFLDFKALKGDASDNIPGVPGVGEKTAAKLLGKFGDLEGIYENLSEVLPASLKEKLAAGKESAFMSKKLAQIMFDAPVSLAEIPDFQFSAEKTREGLLALEFRSLVRKFGLAEADSVDGSVGSASGAVVDKTENVTKKSKNSGDSGTSEITAKTGVETDFRVPEILSWDLKSLMHENEEIAEKVLKGAEYWDLGQAEFLINPLSREKMTLFSAMEPEKEYKRQRAELLKIPRVLEVLEKFDLPLIPVLYKMEKRGVLIDREYFKELGEEFSARLRVAEQEVFQEAGREFNLNSPIQLSEVLFFELRLPTQGIKKTTRGYSTGAKELEKLKNAHPIIEKIKKYREMMKLFSTYITPMSALADAAGRIRTTFTQNVTATGRLSSRDPNLQNIPTRTEEGNRIRTGFIAPEGRVLVSADYSQFELRLAAVLAGDAELMKDFNDGIDIHTKTAAEAFHVPFEKVTKSQRRAAKVINFGVLYGMSAVGLAQAAGMGVGEAKRFIERYFELRAPIKKYLEGILKQAQEKGYVETYFGRRRPTPDVWSKNHLIRTAAERAAENMPIQGTEADLMKRAMIQVDTRLPEGAELILQVHDSLIVECDESLAEEVSRILGETMENIAPELKIRLAVEVKIGKNWGEL